MHAVLVTFHSTMGQMDLTQALSDEAWTMADAPGLVYGTWIQAGARLGSFQVFVDRQAAEQHYAGGGFKRLKANAAFSDFEIRQFEVVGHAVTFSGDPHDAATCQRAARPTS